MVASWMLYAGVLGILVGGAAASVERILRDRGLPSRWIWCGALLLTVALPVAALLRSSGAAPPTPVASQAVSATVGAPLEGVGLALDGRTAPVLARAEAFLLPAWALSTILLVGFLVAALLRLARARAGWREEELDGGPVLVSRDVGPAVLGVVRHEIVLPAWVFAAGLETRHLILAHEREHVRARDPLLYLAGVLTAVLLPWNLPLWFQLRRLRLAVEIDCDRRVLRSASPGLRRRYGHLLLEVGRRRGSHLALAAAFSEGRSSLERRIRGLSEGPPSHPLRRAAVLSAVGGVLITGACLIPGPDGPRSPLGPDAADAAAESPGSVVLGGSSLADPTFTPMTVRPEILNATEVQGALEREYPPLLHDAGIGGRVVAWFFIDETGRVQDTRIAQSSGHPQIDDAALRVAGLMRFSPARNREEPVPVWVQFPITFQAAAGRASAPNAGPPSGAQVRPPGAGVGEGPTFTPMTARPEILNGTEIQQALEREYPRLLRDAGIGGRATVWFLIDETGRVQETRIAQSSGHPQIDDAALRVAGLMRFSPARNREEPVPVWVQFPITFRVR